jgi:hypothetical protein
MADLKPHSYGSFSYKALNAGIGKSLTSKSKLNNTIQLDMSFVKLTSTIQLPEYLGEGNIGFTLGLHAIDQDVKFEDIYSGQEGADANCPLIGYTYTPNGMTRRIYARPPSSEVSGLINLFDGRKKLLNTTKNLYIPPPGITSVTIGRNKNGLLAHGQINFTVPTLSQLEILHRTFLVPGVGMILEWGNQFAQAYDSTEYNELGDITTNVDESATVEKKLFPWYNRIELMQMLNRLARRQVGLEEILKNYVYPTHGQYMWMFGRVANFSTTANSDGSFNCIVKIVGPSEDAWAYSVYNTVIPPADNSGKICAQNVHSVASYFSGTTVGALNLQSLLNLVLSNPAHDWHNHVLKFTNGNLKTGDPDKQPDNAGNDTSQTTFAENEDAYFMTWKFFVNAVLNDDIPGGGVKEIFKLAGMDDAQIKAKISLLRRYDGPINGYIDDPYEPFVGMHKYLRSIDLSTMFIVNERAVNESKDLPEYQVKEQRGYGFLPGKDAFFQELDDSTQPKMSDTGAGDFNLSTAQFNNANPSAAGEGDRGFLSAGVWINHKAVVESMMGAETILHGVTTLLNKMSAATCNYWQLVLDASEPVSETGEEKHEYIVIDANYRENSDVAVGDFLDKVYVFNKYARTDEESGQLVGSELTDCTVDLSLPKRLFSQIATLGLYRTEDLKTLGIESATTQQTTSMPILSDPNEALRKMFGITSLSAKDTAGQGPDLTILPDDERARNSLVNSTQCNKGSSQTAGRLGANKSAEVNVGAPDYAQELAIFTNFKFVGVRRRDDLLPPDKTTLADLQKVFNDSAVCQACTTAEPTDPASSSKPTDDAVPPGPVSYTGTDNKTYSVDIVKDSSGNTTASKLLYSAGYRNGQLPSNVRSSIGSGHSLYSEVAVKYNEMKAAAKAAGVDLIINASYRTVSKQVAMLQEYGLYNGMKSSTNPNAYGAARPGTSNHGWGLSVDLNTAASGWLSVNAPTYGFSPLDNDPVHWTYTGPIAPPKPYAPDVTPQPAQPISPPTTTPTVFDPRTNQSRVCTDKEITECNRLKDVINRGTAIEVAESSKKAAFNGLLRKFDNLKAMWRYVEPYPELMMARIARTADMDASNAFGASPGTLSISADMTLPGINGFRVGELFWIERIPAFYKAFGAFQIISIEDTIDIGGWNTKIHARFNYLGKKWKDSVVRKLQGISATGEGGE